MYHLLTNCSQPRLCAVAPDVHVHDGTCSTPVGKYSTPSGAPDVLYMTVSTVHLMTNAVHQVGLLKYSMASVVHFMANVVHPSVAPDVR